MIRSLQKGFVILFYIYFYLKLVRLTLITYVMLELCCCPKGIGVPFFV